MENKEIVKISQDHVDLVIRVLEEEINRIAFKLIFLKSEIEKKEVKLLKEYINNLKTWKKMQKSINKFKGRLGKDGK